MARGRLFPFALVMQHDQKHNDDCNEQHDDRKAEKKQKQFRTDFDPHDDFLLKTV